MVTAVALALALSGCVTGGTPMSTPSSSPSASSTPDSSGAVPAAKWTAILADLSGRGVATDDVQLVSARSVTWNSGALGCPKPGSSYTQALVNGMQVVVSAAGKQYDYRFGSSDTPKLCEGLK
jgi:hypothetical protein